MVYFVSYSTQSEDHEKKLTELIKAYGTWASVNPYLFLIKTDNSAVSVRNNLATVLGEEDQLFVGKATAPAAWRNYSDNFSDWIKTTLS